MAKAFSTFFALLIFLAFTARAQEKLPDFGQVDTTDLQLKECLFDKSAPAMYLVNYENAVFEVTQGGLYIDIERWARIKIFNQNGYGSASIEIPFISSNKIDKILDIAAYVYNIDEQGNILTEKLEKKDLFIEKSKKGNGYIRFAFPKVKPGTVVEYKYTVERANWPGFDPWLFQNDLPVQLSVCKLKYNSDVDIKMQVHATLPYVSRPDTVKALDGHYKKLEQNFIMQNVPAMHSEPLMSTLYDNLQRIAFAILPGRGHRPAIEGKTIEDDWKIYTVELLNSPYFGGQFSIDIPHTKGTLDSIKALKQDADKIHAVYHWVTRTVQWNGYQSISADDLSEVWKNRKGNSAEINILILNFLRKVGVRCLPLLVSTWANGETDMYFASLTQFDGVDIFAFNGNKYYIIDGTQKNQSYNIPPYNVLNSNAFIADLFTSNWLHIESKGEIMKSDISMQGGIDRSGVLTGKVNVSYFDYARADILAAKQYDDDEPSKSLTSSDVAAKIDSAKTENLNDADKPLIKSFNVKLDLQQTGDYYFLDPFFLMSFKKNPFNDTSRKTDIDFGSKQSYTTLMSIKLPANFIVSELPPDKNIAMIDSAIVFTRSYYQDNEGLQIKMGLRVNRPFFIKEEYAGMKDFFDKIYALLNDNILIKRKDN